eukprot:13099719-Alexandrium_andersonii.AAC.1
MCAGLPPSGQQRAPAESSFSRAFGPDRGAAALGPRARCLRTGLSCIAFRPPPFGLGSRVSPAGAIPRRGEAPGRVGRPAGGAGA